MSEHVVVLGPDGRITVSAAARRELGLRTGDLLHVEADGTSLLIRSYEAVLQESQAFFHQCVSPADRLVVGRRPETA